MNVLVDWEKRWFLPSFLATALNLNAYWVLVGENCLNLSLLSMEVLLKMLWSAVYCWPCLLGSPTDGAFKFLD